ncbi:MAG: transcription termination factor NusA [Patescibacteria group bacterium]
MFDLKVINSVLSQLEEEKAIPREKVLDAIESALATAYKKEYGKKHQIIKCTFDLNTGKTEFFQMKKVISPDMVVPEDEDLPIGNDEMVHFNEERHIYIDDAKRIKKDISVGEEISFPLEDKHDFGRISAQTAKQVIIQKIREAERSSVFSEYGQREGEIVSGTVQRIERGNIFVDLGRATGIIPYEEQIPGERYKQGEIIRGYLYSVEESPRGIFVRISRSHPKFLVKLFENEAPEIATGVVEIKAVAREAGARSKIAVLSHDAQVDPVGACVGQRGSRVSVVTSELGGERIDIVEWSPEDVRFIEEALSPAKINNVKIIDEEEKRAEVEVAEDQLSLAIGKGGQNVRLAAKLTGWKIDIKSNMMKKEENNEEDEGVDYGTEIYTEESPQKEDETVSSKSDEEKAEE